MNGMKWLVAAYWPALSAHPRRSARPHSPTEGEEKGQGQGNPSWAIWSMLSWKDCNCFRVELGQLASLGKSSQNCQVAAMKPSDRWLDEIELGQLASLGFSITSRTQAAYRFFCLKDRWRRTSPYDHIQSWSAPRTGGSICQLRCLPIPATCLPMSQYDQGYRGSWVIEGSAF